MHDLLGYGYSTPAWREEKEGMEAGRPGTRFLCKKPVPGPSGKNSSWLAVCLIVTHANMSSCRHCSPGWCRGRPRYLPRLGRTHGCAPTVASYHLGRNFVSHRRRVRIPVATGVPAGRITTRNPTETGTLRRPSGDPLDGEETVGRSVAAGIVSRCFQKVKPVQT